MNQIYHFDHLIFVVKIKNIMKLAILGNGLTSLTLAKSLVNKGIFVDIFLNQKNLEENKNRTIGLSKKNIEFFNSKILNIKKFLWDIKKIEIYTENLKNEKILNFENDNHVLFSMIKNFQLYKELFLRLRKNKLCNFKKKKYKNTDFREYNLIINCDSRSQITKKFFYKKLNKNYNSFAHTTIIKHKKIKNNIASQIFTHKGPLAFLPLSETETSIVYSAKGGKNINLKKTIEKYNFKYEIVSFKNSASFELVSTNLRSYYYKNILAFGDLLHRIHPLAGQGFNMTMRDINTLCDLINFRMNNGLELDRSICRDFEKKTKHRNYLFSSGIDFVYEFFNVESKINNNVLSKSIQTIGKNKFLIKSFEKIANNGLEI